MKFKDITESSHQCPHCGGPMFSEMMMMEKKDACYYKVKSSAKVWPSAYASGRLVQCRKKGADNYGNKSEGVAEGYQLDEGAIETITALAKKIPGIGKYYQIAQQYKPQLIQILKTSKSGKEVKQKMEQLVAQQSATVAESGMMKQLGGLAVGGGSILSTMWMNAMGLIDGVLAHAAAGEVGGAVASGSILGLIPVTLMLFAAMLMFKGSNQSSDEKAQAFQAQRGQQGVAEGSTNDYFKRRKDEEDRIAGTKAPAKRTPRQTDYEKKRKEQGVTEGIRVVDQDYDLDQIVLTLDIEGKRASFTYTDYDENFKNAERKDVFDQLQEKSWYATLDHHTKMEILDAAYRAIRGLEPQEYRPTVGDEPLDEQGVTEGLLGDREYNRVMPFVKRIAGEVSDYDRDEFGEELWSLLDQKYGSKFAQSVVQDALDFYWDEYTELAGQQGVAEDQLDEINWRKGLATAAMAAGAIGALSSPAQARVSIGPDGQATPSFAQQMQSSAPASSASSARMPNQDLQTVDNVTKASNNNVVITHNNKEYQTKIIPKDFKMIPRGAVKVKVAQAQMGERGIGNYVAYLLPNGTAIVLSGPAAEPANETKGEMWRVMTPRAQGGYSERYYVVKGYMKDLKIWRNKSGAGDFNNRADAEAKVAELNKDVAEGQKLPDTANSRADRTLATDLVPGTAKTASGHPIVPNRFRGERVATRVDPSITPTSVQRKDAGEKPIPAFLRKQSDLDEGGDVFAAGIENTPAYKAGFATGKLPVPHAEGTQEYAAYYKGVIDKATPNLQKAGMEEGQHDEKIAGRYDPDEFDTMVSRLRQRAEKQEKERGPVDLARLAQRLRDIEKKQDSK